MPAFGGRAVVKLKDRVFWGVHTVQPCSVQGESLADLCEIHLIYEILSITTVFPKMTFFLHCKDSSLVRDE